MSLLRACICGKGSGLEEQPSPRANGDRVNVAENVHRAPIAAPAAGLAEEIGVGPRIKWQTPSATNGQAAPLSAASSKPAKASTSRSSKHRGSSRVVPAPQPEENAPLPGYVGDRISPAVSRAPSGAPAARRQPPAHPDLITPLDSFGNGQHGPWNVGVPQQQHLSGEELRDMGFPAYSLRSLQSQLPSSTSLPLAFLALETIDSTQRPGRAGMSAEDGEPGASADVPSTSGRDAATIHARKLRNKLVPLFVNSVCRSYFKISTHKEYAPVIRKLIKRDPLLTFALQKALRYLKAGENKGVNHTTPDPTGQTSSLYGMRISPCVWQEEEGGRWQAALLVEHNVPYNPAEVMPRLMRDYAVLSHVPAILTLIDFQGKVLYQNASSLAYMGDLLSIKYDNRLSEGLLKVLFMYDLNNLEQMLEEVLGGQEWQGVVQVPYSLRRYLATHHATETMVDVNGSFTIQGSGKAVLGSLGAGALASSSLPDEVEVDFQIGNSFTSRGLVNKQRKAVQQKGTSFLLKGNNSGAPGSGPSGLAPPPSASQVRLGSAGIATPLDPRERRSSSGTAGPSSSPTLGTEDSYSHEVRNHLPEHFSHVPSAEPQTGVQQRKFMTLLDKAGAMRGGGEDDDGQGLDAVDENGGEDGYDDSQQCSHEIHAIPLLDPVLDKQVIMLVQTDVTARVELENKLADLTDAQLSMLEQLFPRHIIEYMLARVPSRVSRNLRDLANTHEQVMVLFCDVVGFTSMSKEVEPSQVMHFLNELYEVFDDLVDEYGMYKLDIVGDCYIVVAGLIKEDQDGFVCVDEMDEDQITSNAVRIMQFAKAMLRESQPVLMPHNSEPVMLRIGIHTGPLVSGLVGAKMPKFTLFGDTINTASRMESTCRPGCVHVSDAFARLLPHEDWESTGGTQVKGKGLMETFLWVPNSKRQELLELDPDNAVKNLRKALTMNSFTSMKSRITVRSNSTRSRRHSMASSNDDRSPNANPLMTILHNIRGEDSDENSGGPSEAGTTAGSTLGGTLMRPKSARHRSSTTRRDRRTSTSAYSDYDSKRISELGSRERDRGTHRSSSRSRRPSEGFGLERQKSVTQAAKRVADLLRPLSRHPSEHRHSSSRSRRSSSAGRHSSFKHSNSSGAHSLDLRHDGDEDDDEDSSYPPLPAGMAHQPHLPPLQLQQVQQQQQQRPGARGGEGL